MRTSIAALLTVSAFAAGCVTSHMVGTAGAADTMQSSPSIVNLVQMTDADLGPPRPGLDFRSKGLFAAPGATISIQSGNIFKHFHQDSDEIQYIIEGTGTFWLGDKQREIRPGDLIIIPKGTVHAGTVATAGKFKAIAIKTPPQSADDVHPVN